MGFQKGNKLWMKKKKFKHTQESKDRISNSKKGIPIKHKGQFKKGMIPWNKYTKGLIKINSGSFKKGQESIMKGKNHLEETKKKISESKKSKPSWNKNKILTMKHRINLSLGHSKEKKFTGFKREIRGRIMGMRKYLEWRSAVFKRDNYHCQNCGKKGYLEAHHIIPFAKIVKFFGIRDIREAEKCKELWDVGNGITYCRECHPLFDINRGRKKQLQIQF